MALKAGLIFWTRKPRPHQAWFSHHSCTTKCPGGIRERSPRVELRSGAGLALSFPGSPPARSAVPIFYLASLRRSPHHHRTWLTGPKWLAQIFVASGIATVLLYVVRVNR